MKLLGSAKNKISKDEYVEKLLLLEITEGVLFHCNIIKNDYQEDSRVLFTFIPKKSLGQLFDILPKDFIFFENL